MRPAKLNRKSMKLLYDIDLTAAHSEIIAQPEKGQIHYINTADLIDWIAETKNDPDLNIIYVHSENAKMITISDCGPIHQGHAFTYTDYINYLGDEVDEVVFSYLQASNKLPVVAA